MKICSKCKKEKENSEFQSEKRKSDGLSARCKPCINEDKKTYLDSKRDKIREYNRKKYYEDHDRQKELRTQRSRIARESKRSEINKYRVEWYWKNAERVRARTRELNKRPEAREKEREYSKLYRKRDVTKFKKWSRSTFERAIKYDIIQRPNKCERCMIECKPDGHHTNYKRPLDVQWLCKTCHAQAHGKLKDIKNIA